ncbi:hypothetical protein K505DRAFT_329296 [Melanomma pulvis-pyrius CBS 109.77]|uniref:Uncharacterized protein n=1 Tax=Melanomma pulvis-pyrius CBS 109.77 TaxID=1314802 RepID=A0A6A6WVN6_9PLEO|nr:hypothetical protein K505DRAFT_329296 [Melanomma pulvis-pyrius CBS 109.77]
MRRFSNLLHPIQFIYISWLIDGSFGLTTLSPAYSFIYAGSIDDATTGRFAQSGVTPCTEAREKQKEL